MVKDKIKNKELIQVVWELDNQKTKDREIKNLLKAMNESKINKGLILTYNQEGVKKVDGKNIIIRPVWKWLLEQK